MIPIKNKNIKFKLLKISLCIKKNDKQKIIEIKKLCLNEFSKKFFKFNLFENKNLNKIQKKFVIEKLARKIAK